MVKTVFGSHKELTHVWASQSKQAPRGRSSDGRMSFEGAAIYSYGTHFLLGFALENGTCFLNAEKRSVSTSHHATYVSRASSHMRQIALPDLTELRYVLNAIARGEGKSEVLKIQQYIAAHPDLDFYHAHAIASLCGIKSEKTQILIRKAQRIKTKADADNKARELHRNVRDAEWLAAMSAERFEEWRSQLGVEANSNATFNSLNYLQRNAKRAALKLFRARKLGKAHRFSKGRLATLLSRERTIRTWSKGLHEIAQAAYRVKKASEFAAFKTAYEAAIDDAARYKVAEDSQLWLLREAWQRGTPERDLIDAAQALIDARQQAERFAREVEQRERDKAGFAAWLNSEPGSHCPSSYRADESGAAYLRRSPNGEELQTSQSASVPWVHALKAFRFIKLCRERGEGFKANGRTIRVGHYQVASISAAGDMVAGCHTFKWSEIERLAKREGVFDVQASSEAVEAKEAH